jgi:hypothetical protein
MNHFYSVFWRVLGKSFWDINDSVVSALQECLLNKELCVFLRDIMKQIEVENGYGALMIKMSLIVKSWDYYEIMCQNQLFIGG